MPSSLSGSVTASSSSGRAARPPTPRWSPARTCRRWRSPQSGEALVAAANALGNPALALVTTDQTDELAATPQRRDSGLQRSLAELGTEDLILTGWGQTSVEVPVRLDSFGGTVAGLALSLVGTHTAIPEGASAQLDVSLNGTLVSSVDLGARPTQAAPSATPDPGASSADIDVTETVRAELLRGTNDLRVTLTALPQGGCLPDRPLPPIRVDLDTTDSGFTATRGDTPLAGFAAYPQALDGELDVALRTEGDESLVDAAVRASLIVAALQREASGPLQVTLVPAEEFAARDGSGLLVGAAFTDTVAFDAPIRLQSTRVLDNVDAEVQIGSSQPFAALQSVQVHR